MRSLQAYLAEYPRPWLDGLARWLGLDLGHWEPEEAAARLAAHILQPDTFSQLLASLSPAARAALDHVRGADPPLSWRAFTRRYGPVREMGPARLLQEQPWRTPQSPAEELWYRGLVFRRLVRGDGRWEEVVLVPDEYSLLLPPIDQVPSPVPEACAAPVSTHRTGDAFLEDFVTLLGFIVAEGIHVDREGRPLRGDLARVGERFVDPLPATALLHPPPRVHLLFHHLQALALAFQEGNRWRVRLRRAVHWLRQPRAYQRFTLWRAWLQSDRWYDLWFVEHLECAQGGWDRPPSQPRQRVMARLRALDEGVWYRVKDLVHLVWHHDPDFYRQGGEYDSWVVRRRNDGRWLRGEAHWHDVEGALIRFYITGPLLWLDTMAVGELDDGTLCAALTAAGRRWLQGRSEPMRQERPPARLTADLQIEWAGPPHPLDRFRVSRFAAWEATRPQFRYRITEESWTRALSQGVSWERLLRFLREITHNQVPDEAFRVLYRWTFRRSPSRQKGG